MKLTAATVARAKLPDGKTDVILFDEQMAGFGLRLRASENGKIRRTWIAQYRIHSRTRRVLIGPVERVPADMARKNARRILGHAATGADPQAERQAKRRAAEHTLLNVCESYLQHAQTRLRPNSIRSARLYLTGSAYFGPLHRLPIVEITLSDVAARLRAIERSSSAHTAGRAWQALSAAFKWAGGQGYLGEQPRNPVAWTHAPANVPSRDRTLDDSEIRAIWRACQDAGEYGAIVRLLLLLGARRQEVGGMRWSELDLDKGLWRLPAARAKNKRELVLPLPESALAFIRAIPPRYDRDCLFGGGSPNGFVEWSKAKAALDERLGDTVKPWRLHDLRRSFVTGLANLGVLPHVVELCVNHTSGHRSGVAAIYDRSRREKEVAQALALWADKLRSIVEGGGRKVIRFPR
jgi:integrase